MYSAYMTRLVYLCILLSTITLFTDSQITLAMFPKTWGQIHPTGFAIVPPQTQQQYTTLVITLHATGYPYHEVATTGWEKCVIRESSPSGGIEETTVDAVNDVNNIYTLTHQLKFNQNLSLAEIDVECNSIYGLEEPQGGLQLSIDITAEFDVILMRNSFVNYLGTTSPNLFTQFMWKSNPSNDAVNQALVNMIDVHFTFTSPLGYNHDRYYISHRLLDSDLITSRHIAPADVPLFNDRLRLYNLFGENTKSCVDPVYGQNSIVHLNTDDQRVVIEKNPAARTRHYLCTFTLQYPADALASILYLEAPADYNPVFIRSDTGSTYSCEDMAKFLPSSSIPAVQLQTTALAPPQVMIWVSPSHRRAITDFEFAIAATNHYISPTTGLGPMPLPAPDVELIIHIYRQGMASPVKPRSITCYHHYQNSNELSAIVSINRSPLLPLEPYIEHFTKFGLQCRVRLTNIDLTDVTSATVQFSLPQGRGHKGLTFLDSFHRAILQPHRPFAPDIDGLNPPFTLTLYPSVPSETRTNLDPDVGLPPIEPISFHQTTRDAKTFITGNMHLQPLSPTPLHTAPVKTTTVKDQMYLNLVIPSIRNYLDVVTRVGGGSTAHVVISTITQGYLLYDGNIELDYVYGRYPDSLPVDTDDIFINGRPIRAPTLIIPLPPLVLTSVYPLSLTIEFEVIPTTPHTLDIYPILLPNYLSRMGVYMPDFALFSRVRTAPLTGFSYRCVTWDRMVTNYVPISPTTNDLTVESSSECPSIHPEEWGAVSVDVSDSNLWKRVQYAEVVNTQGDLSHTCLYELPVVCVTPSATHAQDGTYDAHPLADCPPPLPQHHAIPCSAAGDNLSNPYSFILMNAQYNPALDVVDVVWHFNGDPRLHCTVAIGIAPAGTVIADIPLVEVASFIPLHISPVLPSLSQQNPVDGVVFSVPVPIYYGIDPDIEMEMHIRLNVHEIPHKKAQTAFPFQSSSPSPSPLPQCDKTQHQTLYPGFYLCVCEQGYRMVLSDGVKNPFPAANQFTCVPRCADGFQWNSDREECGCAPDGNACLHYGVCNPSTMQCTCFDGYFGQFCQYDDADDVDYVCEQLECVADHVAVPDEGEDHDNECKVYVDVNDNNTTTVVCNCADGFTGDQCQHAKVCGNSTCLNGRLTSPTGKPEECKCECNNDHITGTSCNQCTLACRNGGVANTRCTACQCPAGYIGATCTIPVWYHTFTLRNLPQHIVELILGTTASDKEEMAILQQTMVKYLLEDYSRVLSETFIVVDGNGDGSGDNGNPGDNDDTRIRVRVELSQFQTVIPPANPNAPYVHIQLMLYPADMTEEMLAYALQHGLVFDWSRVTGNLDFFKQFLRDQGIIDDENGNGDDHSSLVPEIEDPGCTTRECRDEINNNVSHCLRFSSIYILTFFLVMISGIWTWI